MGHTVGGEATGPNTSFGIGGCRCRRSLTCQHGRQIQPDSTAVTQRGEMGPFKAADTALTLGQRDLHLRSLCPSSRDRRRQLASVGHSRSSPRTSMNTKAGELDGAAAEHAPDAANPRRRVHELVKANNSSVLQLCGPRAFPGRPLSARGLQPSRGPACRL